MTVDELDKVVTASLGIRWAVTGPFQSFHLGGGPGAGGALFVNQSASVTVSNVNLTNNAAQGGAGGGARAWLGAHKVDGNFASGGGQGICGRASRELRGARAATRV